MSNQTNNLVEYRQDVLGRFADARTARRFGEALVWLNTAAVLDSESERLDPASPVNLALFQTVFDCALASEELVLKCGNVTTTHGEWLAYGREAVDLLVDRLDQRSAEETHGLAVVLQGHFNNLFEQFDRHFDLERQYTLTSAVEARLMLDTTRTVRQLIAETGSIKIDTDLDLARRAALLGICTESPDYLVAGFPVRFLSVWDKAVFFIEAAQGLLTEITGAQAFAAKGDKAALVADLDQALKNAHQLTSQKSKSAKQSYRRMRDLGLQLAAVCAR